MRKTKIVCTIGPASGREEVLREMCLAGMNVARLNFSHGTHAQHLELIERIKKVREELGLPIAILLDTKGPEYRIRTFKNGKITLRDGDEFIFTTAQVEGDETRVSVSYPALHKEMRPGDRILVNNGLLVFEVESVKGHLLQDPCRRRNERPQEHELSRQSAAQRLSQRTGQGGLVVRH